MPPGEVPITCPHCQHRTTLPVAAVKRDNFYCQKCLQKVPLNGFRTHSDEMVGRTHAAKPKKSSRGYHR